MKRKITVWSRVVPFDQQPIFGAYDVVEGDSELADLEIAMAIGRVHLFDKPGHGRAELMDNLTAGLVRV